MSGGSGRANRAGPRRSETARQAVLEAADDLLLERGFAGLTVEGIAQRSGVAKQTIYRWWKSKVDILLDTLAEDAETALAWEHGGGDPVEELVAQVQRVVHFIAEEAAGQVMKSLLGHALHDPVTARRLREGFLAAQRERDLAGLRHVLERLHSAPADDAALAALLDRLLGPVHYRLLVLGAKPDAAFVRDLVNGVLAAAVRERTG
jgi:AcrR family transcriptional regulator